MWMAKAAHSLEAEPALSSRGPSSAGPASDAGAVSRFTGHIGSGFWGSKLSRESGLLVVDPQPQKTRIQTDQVGQDHGNCRRM